MKIRFLLLLALSPLCASAQGVVYVPSPPFPGQYPPFNQYGVMIGKYAPEVQDYAIDLNEDGVVDYTLTMNAGLSGFPQFNIIPAGNNSVLAYVDEYGAANVVNLGVGVVLGPETPSSLNPIWANSGNSYPPTLNFGPVDLGIDQSQLVFGTFASTTGFVGLQFWIDDQAYYGFLQLDTRWTLATAGGMYQGYGWNTTPDESITTTYFRDLLQVPEPSTWTLLGLGIVMLAWRKRKLSGGRCLSGSAVWQQRHAQSRSAAPDSQGVPA